MANEDLAAQPTMLNERGQPDLQLSEAARGQFVSLIKNYRRELKAARDKAAGLQVLGNPGTIPSALDTRDRLMLNVTDREGMLPTLDRLIEHADALESAVNAASGRLQAEA